MKKEVLTGVIILIVVMLTACSQGTGTNIDGVSGNAVVENVSDDSGNSDGFKNLDDLDKADDTGFEEIYENETVEEVQPIGEQANDGQANATLEPVDEVIPAGEEIEEEASEFTVNNKELIEGLQPEPAMFSPDLFVHFIDVGHGDATLIQTPKGKTILIDCGPDESERTLKQYFESRGIKEIDALIVTNTESEYIGGCDDILDAFDVKKVYDNGLEVNFETYKDYRAAIRFHGVSLVHLINDLILGIDPNLELKIITPWHTKRFLSNVNDNSLLVKMDYGETSFLFAGSCQKGCERELLEKEEDLDVDVLKVGGHGRNEASTELFLDAVSPEIAVIMVGADADYEMPSLSAMDRIRKQATIFRTDYDSTVMVGSDGIDYKVIPTLGVPHWDPEVNVSFTPYHQCPYVGHVMSNMFYSIDCNYIDNIKPGNRVCFESKEQAIELGRRESDQC